MDDGLVYHNGGYITIRDRGNKMNKEEFVKRYGEETYEKVLEQNRQWAEANPEKMKAKDHERNRKGGKYYLEKQRYNHTGLQGERNIVRTTHGRRWRKYKNIIAPGSQVHHEWIPGTSRYRGIALVEGDAHQHGIIDVIEILEGSITVLLEERGELAKMRHLALHHVPIAHGAMM